MSAAFRLAAACSLALFVACSPNAQDVELAQPDGARFATEVYPVLLRDCGMSQCHGAEARFFRVFGPGRTRLDADTDVLAPATPQEILTSYNRARALLEPPPHARDSLLLRKPLARDAGGTSHEGSNVYGRNVYADTQAEGYALIAAWADSMEASSR